MIIVVQSSVINYIICVYRMSSLYIQILHMDTNLRDFFRGKRHVIDHIIRIQVSPIIHMISDS